LASANSVTLPVARACPGLYPAEAVALEQMAGLRVLQALCEMRGILGSAGLRFACYKGPALAAQAWYEPALRESGDLDFLLPHDDAMRAYRLLLEQGFTPDNARASDSLEGRWLSPHACNLPTLIRTSDGLQLELHWALSARSFGLPLPLDGMWCSSVEVGVAPGVLVKSPSPAWHLLAAAIHGAKHRWERLKWVADVAQLLDRYPGALAEARSIAKTQRLARVLDLATALATGLLGNATPQKSENGVGEVDSTLIAVSIRRMSLGLDAKNDEGSLRERLAYQWRLREGSAKWAWAGWRLRERLLRE